MKFSGLPYDPPPRSHIRERLLEQQTKRLGKIQSSLSALQAYPERSLSPVERALNAQYFDFLKDEKARLADRLEAVKRQEVAEAQIERHDKGRLYRARERVGLFRTQVRNAAILGILERERRQNAPLSREAWSRAKAIAASRRLYSEADFASGTGLFGSRGYAYSVRQSDLASSVDPCAQAVARQRVRREVLFAHGFGGRGYRGRKRRRIC